LDWLPIDTDIAEDDAIQELIDRKGYEGFGFWMETLTRVAAEIDYQNENNGQLTIPGRGKSAAEYLAFITDKSEEFINSLFDTCAELQLIDQTRWKEKGLIYYGNLLKRDKVQSYLKMQKAGYEKGKGADKSEQNPPQKRGLNRGLQRGQERGFERDKDIDTDKDINSTCTNNPESDDSEDFSEGQLRDQFGEQPIEFTDHFIERQKQINPRRNTPDGATKQYRDWVQAFDRLHRIGPSGGTPGQDGYSWDELCEILSFALDDEFWKKQVKSPVQLRKKSNSNGNAKIVNIEDSMMDQSGSEFDQQMEGAV
jgi:hypothetical protein